ncbi:hypothetical protein AB0G15_18825 [Streptosporangium sp. NPDC023825]|uniref:hypothetical protein n=1 Tax=Streptosporangium sp. NPDC023825 TaxID=3154909 RepID=UPI00342FD8D9
MISFESVTLEVPDPTAADAFHNRVDQVALLLGVADVKAGKRFHVDRGARDPMGDPTNHRWFRAPRAAPRLDARRANHPAAS